MFTRTLFFTLICTFALHATDDTIIMLQSNDGASVTLPISVAKHSVTLSNLIEDCPSEQAIPLNELNQHELELLVDVLNTIHQAASDGDDAIAKLRNNIHRETEFTLSYLDSFFVIPLLERALLHDIAAIFALKKNRELADKSDTLQHIFTSLQESYDQHNVKPNELVGMQHIACIIKNAQIHAKKQFLKSAGTINETFFTGVSVGDLARNSLIDLHYKFYEFSQTSEMYLGNNNINSLDGLICKSAPTRNKKSLCILSSALQSFPANAFQHVQDPEELELCLSRLYNMSPDTFAGLHTLKRLSIWLFDRFELPLGIFDSLTNLEQLDLKTSSFDTRLLKYCTKLKTLELTSNNLREIPSWWPKSCSGIENLFIRHNEISSIPPLLCKQFPQLQTLYLAYNSIQHIHADIFKDCQNLIALELHGNPIPQQEITALRTALPHLNI